ncbi:helix-turn-helix domain-containing protein [Oxalobacter formigenes]|uniref:helix-turn-helix domain-containing protein n=1 Tax=Oxalobacter formigenes TaxID=847 RepID=UPI00241F8833|nr:helix-turn-helix domain-containing protein [Oxalobacter formigenes]
MNTCVNTQMNRNLLKYYSHTYISKMGIGNRLDEAMLEAGYKSQAELARASGVPQPTISRILKGTGKKGPETETIKKLAGSCGVNSEWLITGNGEKYISLSKQSTLHAAEELSEYRISNQWPIKTISLQEYNSLGKEEKKDIEKYILLVFSNRAQSIKKISGK